MSDPIQVGRSYRCEQCKEEFDGSEVHICENTKPAPPPASGLTCLNCERPCRADAVSCDCGYLIRSDRDEAPPASVWITKTALEIALRNGEDVFHVTPVFNNDSDIEYVPRARMEAEVAAAREELGRCHDERWSSQRLWKEEVAALESQLAAAQRERDDAKVAEVHAAQRCLAAESQLARAKAEGIECAQCGANHRAIMWRALVDIFDYTGTNIQAIKNTAYRALPRTGCLESTAKSKEGES